MKKTINGKIFDTKTADYVDSRHKGYKEFVFFKRRFSKPRMVPTFYMWTPCTILNGTESLQRMRNYIGQIFVR